jgi:hypothetical protein
MRRDSRIAAFVLLTIGLGCGHEAGPGMSIEFADRALLSQAEVLAIYFYKDEGADCGTIRATRPRPPSVLGPFLAELGDPERQNGALLRFPDIPPGTYVVFVDAQTRSGSNVGTGCTPGQVVAEDQLSTIQVVISE